MLKKSGRSPKKAVVEPAMNDISDSRAYRHVPESHWKHYTAEQALAYIQSYVRWLKLRCHNKDAEKIIHAFDVETMLIDRLDTNNAEIEHLNSQDDTDSTIQRRQNLEERRIAKNERRRATYKKK